MSDRTTEVGAGGAHQLITAIASLRDDLGRLFEEHVVRADDRRTEARTPPPAVAAEAVSIPAIPPTTAPVVVAPTCAAPDHDPPAPRPSALSTPPPPRETADVAAGPSTGRAHDPRQRLDALAKLLDRRLKPSAGSAVVTTPVADGG